MVLETLSHVAGNQDPSKSMPKTPEPSKQQQQHHRHQAPALDSRGRARERCSKLIVGEEPLVLEREDPNGIQHTFVGQRRYTLRAVGPGVCTLLDIPRAFVRRYLPYKGLWAESLQRQAARRHVSKEGVETAHRCRRTYETMSEGEWGPAMLERAARHRKQQEDMARQISGQAKHQAEGGAEKLLRKQAEGFREGGGGGSRGDGGGSSGKTTGRRGAGKAAASNSSSSAFAVGSGGASKATTLQKTGSMSTTIAGATQTDVWDDRARMFQNVPRKHQGKWGEGLGVQLPMVAAGVPGIQRGAF